MPMYKGVKINLRTVEEGNYFFGELIEFSFPVLPANPESPSKIVVGYVREELSEKDGDIMSRYIILDKFREMEGVKLTWVEAERVMLHNAWHEFYYG
jgi:hypothetical protein